MDTYSSVSGDYQMFENKMQFQELPKNVTIKDMLRHMFLILIKYDKAMSEGQDAEINPMSGRIIMNLEDGNSMEIPESIQRLAIVKFLEMKTAQKIQQSTPKPAPKKQVVKQQKSDDDNNMMPMVYVVLVVAIIFMLYKYFTQADNYAGVRF
jgi:hypothetical protein